MLTAATGDHIVLPAREALALALTLVGAALLIIAGWIDGDAVRGLYTTGGVLAVLGVLLGFGGEA